VALQARRRTAAAAAALVVLAATLVHDAIVPSRLSHPRPLVVLVVAGVLAVALLTLAPRVRSLVRGGIAFNLADVAIAVGDALLVSGALVRAWTNRARLREPI